METRLLEPRNDMTSYRHNCHRMREMVHLVIISLVDHPLMVEVDAVVNPFNADVALRVSVERSDVGKVIGKQGRTARAIRLLLAAASQRDKITYSLDIVEDRAEASK